MQSDCRIIECNNEQDYAIYNLQGSTAPVASGSTADCRLIECTNEPDYGTYVLQDFTPPPTPLQPYNDKVYVTFTCPHGQSILFTGTLPSWISFDINNGVFTGNANTFQAPTKKQANDIAQNALNIFVSQQEAAGNLFCSTPCSTPTIIFIPDQDGSPGTPSSADYAAFIGSTIYLIDDGGNVFTATDGINWTFTGNQIPLVNTTSFADDGAGVIVAVGGFFAGGQTSRSLDSTATWTNHSIGNTSSMFSIVFATGIFVTVGQNGDVASSADGITWSLQNLTGGTDLNALIFANGQFVAVGKVGQIYTSPDAITWTAQTSGTGSDLTGITYGNGVYVAVGGTTVLTSSDGIAWSTKPAPPASFLSISFNEGNFVTGVNTTLDDPSGSYFSKDASSWTPVTTTPPPPNTSLQIRWILPIGNCQFVACEATPPT